MRLDDARLCLDCEEIHKEQECPACGSEAFAFLTRWIQSTAPKPKKPQAAAATPRSARAAEHLAAWQEIADGGADDSGRGKKIVARSLLGLAAMGIAGWAWAKTSPSKDDDS
jgi:hypothetical protein